jgi:hypothetical protein
VHADPRAGRDRGADPLDRGDHVAQRQGVVARILCVEEGAGDNRVVETSTDEHRRRCRADAELVCKRLDASPVARSGDPAAVLHRPLDGTDPSDDAASRRNKAVAAAKPTPFEIPPP